MVDIHQEIIALAEFIKKDPNRIKLKEAQEIMEANEEVFALYLEYKNAQEGYSSALNHYAEDSIEVKKSLKTLYLKKKALEEHKDVMSYNEILKAVNEPLRYLEFNLLYKFTI